MKLASIVVAGLTFIVAACTGLDPHPKGDDYDASVKKADEARQAGDLDMAIPLYGRALQSNPQGLEAKLGLGQSYLSMGASSEAAAQFRDVTKCQVRSAPRDHRSDIQQFIRRELRLLGDEGKARFSLGAHQPLDR